MPLQVLDARTEEGSLQAMRGRSLWEGPDIARHVAAVRRVVEDVQNNGDEALVRYSKLVYGAELSPDRVRSAIGARAPGPRRVDQKVITALEGAADHIRQFHDAQKPGDWSMDRE